LLPASYPRCPPPRSHNRDRQQETPCCTFLDGGQSVGTIRPKRGGQTSGRCRPEVLSLFCSQATEIARPKAEFNTRNKHPTTPPSSRRPRRFHCRYSFSMSVFGAPRLSVLLHTSGTDHAPSGSYNFWYLTTCGRIRRLRSRRSCGHSGPQSAPQSAPPSPRLPNEAWLVQRCGIPSFISFPACRREDLSKFFTLVMILYSL